MVSLGANGNIKTYGMKHFILDTVADLSTIQTSELVTGSTAFVISTSTHYMLNSSKNWIRINLEGGGGDSEEVEYDGGDVL